MEEHPSSEEVIKPFLRGRDVKRWRVDPQDQWLIFTRRGIDIKKYPAILRRLKAYKQELEPMPDDWDTKRNGPWPGRKPGSYKWYEIQDNIAYWQEFEQPKIIVPAISDRMNFAPDFGGFYTNNKTTIFIAPSVGLALGVANSQVTFWFAQQMFATKQGGFFDFEPRYSSQIPIPEASPQQQHILERIVGYLIALHEGASGELTAISAYCEQLVNGLVYELFFPDELHAQKLFLFKYTDEAKLPDLDSLLIDKRLSLLREAFERISDLNHPIRSCLFSLQALEVVRIIEGEA
jgi:hypothetical protein